MSLTRDDMIIKRAETLESMAMAMLNEAKALRQIVAIPEETKHKKISPAVAALVAKAKIKHAVKTRTA
jgi:hypothetical protein